jgi:osmotically-inducible protein OsmY
MRRGWLLVGGIGLGVALIYVLDPEKGRRRRALARDKVRSASRRTGLYLDRLSRDARNRAVGLLAETTEDIRAWAGQPRGGRPTDEQLVARVKTNLGRHAVHHRALKVKASGGRVTLSGKAIASEVDEIVAAVESVEGVEEVVNRLDVYAWAGDVSSLQGEVVAPPSSGRW